MSKIAELRKRSNLTQLELSQAIGVTESTVSNWESGRSTGWIERVRRLCTVLDCTPNELIPITRSQENA